MNKTYVAWGVAAAVAGAGVALCMLGLFATGEVYFRDQRIRVGLVLLGTAAAIFIAGLFAKK